MTRRALYRGFIIYFIVVIGFVTLPPCIRVINKSEPFICGIPFFQLMVFVIVFLIGAGLIIWFKLEEELERKINLERKKGGKDE